MSTRGLLTSSLFPTAGRYVMFLLILIGLASVDEANLIWQAGSNGNKPWKKENDSLCNYNIYTCTGKIISYMLLP